MTQNNVKVAITGGIGSGKSVVAQIVKNLGYTALSCDEIYSELLNDKKFLSAIENEFSGVVGSDEILDRAKLSQIVFNDNNALKKLNSITHSAIMNEVMTKLKYVKLGFCEVPLLFEGGFENLFDEVIVVLRDESERISAVSNRDKIDKESIKKRIRAQINYHNFDFTKYYVIHNDCVLPDLALKTAEIISNIEKKYFKKILF